MTLKKNYLIFGLFCFSFMIVLVSTDTLSTNEFCQLETFNPKCSPNEVIYIQKAHYGRMKEGRCITQEEIKGFGSSVHDPKYFGCSADVVNILHKKCSFARECNIKVPDESFKKTSPCLPGLIMHLEVDYSCLPVYQTEGSNCRQLVTEKEKYFISESLKEKHCGTANNPWIFEASKGHKVSMMLFGQPAKESELSSQCDNFGIILQDGHTRKNSSLCSRDWLTPGIPSSGNDKNIFKSLGNFLKMFIRNEEVASKNIFLKIKAEGCLDIIPPEDTWLKRNNDDIVIGCYSSKQTWYLRCENGQWSGSVGNCSHSSNNPVAENVLETQKSDPKTMPKNQQILAIVTICGMGTIVCSLIICVGAVCARRYSSGNKAGQLKLSSQSYDNAYNQHTYQHGIGTGAYQFSNGQIVTDGDHATSVGTVGHDQTYFVLEDNKEDEINENLVKK